MLSEKKEELNESNTSFDSNEAFFDDFVASIRVDQVALDTNTASAEKVEMYGHMKAGNFDALIKNQHNQITQAYIPQVVGTFFQEAAKRNVQFKKLALDLRNRNVYVWAEIEDENYTSEKGIFLSEATVNSEFHNFGFYISTTVVESSDNQKIPSHYKEVNLRSKN